MHCCHLILCCIAQAKLPTTLLKKIKSTELNTASHLRLSLAGLFWSDFSLSNTMCFSYPRHMPCTEHTYQSTPLVPNFILGPLSRILFLPFFILKNLVHPSKTADTPLLQEDFLKLSFFSNQERCDLSFPLSLSSPTAFLPTHLQWLIVFYLLCGTNDYRLL